MVQILERFLLPWLLKFECDELMIGGNIARANALFGPALIRELEPAMPSIKIIYCNDAEDCILTGAAFITEDKINKENSC